MKIIDAHLHLFPPSPGTDAMAEGVGHKNSVEHLRQVYGTLGMVHGVIMGNRSLETDYHNYPADLFHYCVGLDSALMEGGERVILLWTSRTAPGRAGTAPPPPASGPGRLR